MNAKVIVMPKAAVLDPQGNAVRDAMRHLGMPEVRSVRIGKYMEIEIEGQDGELESRLHQLCRDLLSNPVIEDYELLKGESGNKERKTKTSEEEEECDESAAIFFCVVFPPLAVLMTGRIASFFLSIILTLLGWIPGVIHACLVVNDYHAEQRAAAARIRCTMNFAVIQFPGSNCDQDCVAAINGLDGLQAEYVWHKETSLDNFDAIVLPGGFAYGDYLRCGAIARFSPIMKAVISDARAGKLVLGTCNGFQVLCEAGLLPGALVRNRSLRFVCDMVTTRVEVDDSPFTHGCPKGTLLRLPVAHGEGCFC